jgi:hypothetical protein
LPNEEAATMSWSVKGSYFENCTCELACPCNVSSLALPATYDRCRAFVAFQIEEGEAGGTDLSGRRAAIFLDSPKMMVEGGWSFGVVVDDGASDEQAERLGAIFSGKDGGPLEPLAGLIANDLGVERHPIEFVEDGRNHRIRIGDGTVVSVEDIHAEGQAEPTKLANVNIPFNTTLTLAVGADDSRLDLFGFQVDLAGKSAASAPFAWAG